jgi:hypothetical protein
LIDTDHGVIVDVEATRAIRQAEVGASRTMVERTEERFGLNPGYLVCQTPLNRDPSFSSKRDPYADADFLPLLA